MQPTQKPDTKNTPGAQNKNKDKNEGNTVTWKETNTNIENLERDWSVGYNYRKVSSSTGKYQADEDVGRTSVAVM